MLPFVLSVFTLKNWKTCLVLIFLICTIPLNYLSGSIFPLKYIRIILMLFLLVVLFIEIKPKISYTIFAAILFLLLILNIAIFKVYPNNYFKVDGEKGVSYEKDILVKKCLGDADLTGSFPLDFNVVKTQKISEKEIGQYYSKAKNENISKAILINDSLLIYLSDLQQGVGMNKLRMVKRK